ncbi:MAG: hypothetical protein JO057_22995 [Chloroflexi bacterium]|nr:hypothetical protein [Chloroflexota bacterium]
MASKQLVTLSGAVEQINAKGTSIKLLGEWLNVSQYHPIAPMPTPGELVEAQVEQTDKGAWINSLRIIGASSAQASANDRTAIRLAALQAAAVFCGHKATMVENVGTAEVLRVAEAFEAWALKGGDADR